MRRPLPRFVNGVQICKSNPELCSRILKGMPALCAFPFFRPALCVCTLWRCCFPVFSSRKSPGKEARNGMASFRICFSQGKSMFSTRPPSQYARLFNAPFAPVSVFRLPEMQRKTRAAERRPGHRISYSVVGEPNRRYLYVFAIISAAASRQLFARLRRYPFQIYVF